MGLDHDTRERAQASRTDITAALKCLYDAASTLNALVGETSTACVLCDLTDRYDVASETIRDLLESAMEGVTGNG